MLNMAQASPYPAKVAKSQPAITRTARVALVPTEDGDSPRPGLGLLEHASEHAMRVREVLRGFGYEPYVDLDSDDVNHLELVEEAVASQDVDVLIVHIVGHGELADGSSEKLYVLNSAGQRLRRPVTSWITDIEDAREQRPLTLFILDVCYAGEAAVTSWHARMDVTKRRSWVLAATGPGRKAFGYRLSRAVVAVLQKYVSREIRFDPSVRYIPRTTVYREIERTVNALIEEDRGLPHLGSPT